MSLFAVFCDHAASSPDNEFLVEDIQNALTYAEACIVVTNLLAPRLQDMDALRCEHPKVVLLSQNNSLVPLLTMAIWAISGSVTPLSPSADPTLWPGMVNSIQPDLIVVSPTLSATFTNALATASLSARCPNILDITTLIPAEFASEALLANNLIPTIHRWIDYFLKSSAKPREEMSHAAGSPPIDPKTRAITLFTSSAVDWSTLKCVSYTHEMLYHTGRRAILMLGGEEYSRIPKRHLGWLPLSHCFEMCISFL
jgi:long-subunit acyl-CoA synthetase (AMP-forming)